MMSQNQWSEDNSRLYRQLAAVAVPARAEQIATLLTVLPFGRDERFHALELASGEGYLSSAILQAFPRATLVALDGSAEMRAATTERLEAFSSRGQIAAFDLAAPVWYPYLDGADVVVSSLCIHHLSGAEKQHLFEQVYVRTSSRGVLLIADLVKPQHPAVWGLFGDTWDRSASQQAMDLYGSAQLHELFVREHWNYFRHADIDDYDQPSPLADQLVWLNAAGFSSVDCFWMQAGHAIYGGYKSIEPVAARLSFSEALQIAQAVLDN